MTVHVTGELLQPICLSKDWVLFLVQKIKIVNFPFFSLPLWEVMIMRGLWLKEVLMVNVEDAVIHLGMDKKGFQCFNPFRFSVICLQIDIPAWSVFSVPLLLSLAPLIAPSNAYLEALPVWLKALLFHLLHCLQSTYVFVLCYRGAASTGKVKRRAVKSYQM